jgi:hypothetical protein
VNK